MCSKFCATYVYNEYNHAHAQNNAKLFLMNVSLFTNANFPAFFVVRNSCEIPIFFSWNSISSSRLFYKYNWELYLALNFLTGVFLLLLFLLFLLTCVSFGCFLLLFCNWTCFALSLEIAIVCKIVETIHPIKFVISTYGLSVWTRVWIFGVLFLPFACHLQFPKCAHAVDCVRLNFWALAWIFTSVTFRFNYQLMRQWMCTVSFFRFVSFRLHCLSIWYQKNSVR